MDPETIMAVINLLGVGAGFFGPNAAQWDQGAKVNRLNQGDALSEFFKFMGTSLFDPARQAGLEQLNTPLNGPQQSIFDQLGALNSNLGGFQSTIPGLMQNAMGIVDPRSLGPQATEVFDAAQQDLQNRGNTDQLTYVEDRLREFQNANRQAFGPVLQSASDIIQSGGRTAESQAMSQEMMDIIGNGGQTAELQQLFGLGTGLVEAGGMTPVLQQLMGQFNSQLRSGGLTPEARRILGPLTAIIEAGGAGGGVLSDDAAGSFARDAAATASAQQAEAVRRQAIQRGGAPGTTVGSGLQNSVLGEFADQSAQNEARALREAMLGQQQARLQQLGIATQGSASILSDASRLLASANAGLGSIAGASASNLATGAGLASDSQRIASQNLGLGIQGFNANFANENARLGAGGDIFSSVGSLWNQGELGAANGMMGVEQARRAQQNAAAAQMLGLGQQALDTRGQNISGTNNLISQMLAAFGQQGQNLQTGGAIANAGRDDQLSSIFNFLTNSSSIFGNIPSLFGSTVSAISPQSRPGKTESFLTGLAGGSGENSGDALQTLMGFFGGGGGGGGSIGYGSGGTYGYGGG